MKNDFGDKKTTLAKIIEFLDSKGFYIILVICVIIVGLTVYYISAGNQRSSGIRYPGDGYISEETGDDSVDETGNLLSEDLDTDEENQEDSHIDTEDALEDIQVDDDKIINKDTSNGPEESESAINTENAAIKDYSVSNEDEPVNSEHDEHGSMETEDAVDDSSLSMETAAPVDENFALPVFGSISLDFAMDKLLYSKTLDEWRTHSGIDIEAPVGTPVKAVADGVVSAIKEDPRYGILVILDHGNGLKTIYANLADGNMVVPNQKVKKGDVIGSIGNTAVFEIAEPTHLHFEVLKDGKLQDPKEYLSIN